MKKKIRDLTVDEIINICGNQISCKTCPFDKTLCADRTSHWEDDKLEQEVDTYENI